MASAVWTRSRALNVSLIGGRIPRATDFSTLDTGVKAQIVSCVLMPL